MLFFIIIIFPINSLSDEITLYSDCWKPYICSDIPDKKGILVDTAEIIFNDAGHSVKFIEYPWKRAIKFVRKGKGDAIVGAAKKDAPSFIYPEEHIIIQKSCFYTLKDSQWKFEEVDKLPSLKIGYTNGYHYSKLFDKYIQKNKGNKKYLFPISGSSSLERGLKLLKFKRIDAFIEDPIIIQSYIYKNQESSFRNSGCLEEIVKLYIPFSPKLSTSKKYAKILSDGLSKIKGTQKLKNISDVYGIDY